MKSWIESAFADEPNISVQPPTKVRKTLTTTRKKTTPQLSLSSTSSSSLTSTNKLSLSLNKILTNNQLSNQINNTNQIKKPTNKIPLTEKYEPKKRLDLVVHKSKIEQLSGLIDQITNKPNGSILIIEGPPGCGKNATLNVLCCEKNIDIMQWTQPNMTLSKIETNDLDYQTDYQQYESQTKLFDQFLFKSSRYISDQIFNRELRTKKILYLKDLPYFAYRDIGVFQSMLRQFNKYSKYSLVISLTTSPAQSNELNPSRVLTQDLRKELNMCEITFNPLATSYMLKQIERIAQVENLTFTDSNAINDVCQSSDGDLRHAINILELATVKSKSNITATAKKRKPTTNKDKSNRIENEPQSELIQKKDANYSIFRGLGKVLHRKNDTENEAQLQVEFKLPKKLMKHFRQPLFYSPEEICAKLPISEDLTTMYLHQNYLELYAIKSSSFNTDSQLDTLIHFADNFILADMVNSKLSLLDQSASVYNTKYKEIPALISIRSVLFNSYINNEDKLNTTTNTKSLWMPLHKPFNYKCNELKRQRKQLAEKILFKDGNAQLASYLIEMQNEFFCTILPFANRKNMYKELGSKYNSQVKHFKFKSVLNNNNENDPSNFMDDENIEPNEQFFEKKDSQMMSCISENKNKFYEYDDNANIQIPDF